MKRIAIVTCALAMAAGTANAQGLTMQMSNGWAFSFSGNVNAFLVYTDPKCSDDGYELRLRRLAGSGTGEEAKTSRIRTGLLPAFATFEAKGKEGGVDLGVHFGFAPQINNAERCARSVRRADRHASGVPDGWRHLGTDPRRS